MQFETNKDKGRAGMAMGIAYFGTNGYTVSIPLNDTQYYDFIIEKDRKFQTVQCKATGSKNNYIRIQNTGGTKGEAYSSMLIEKPDLIFCLDSEQRMFIIPIEDLIKSGNLKSFKLSTEPNKNNQGFETYKYLVTL